MDVLLDRADSVLTAGGVRPMTGAWRQRFQQQNQDWSEQGLRVLAMAYKEADGVYPGAEMSICSTAMEHDYIFLGLVAMMDPPRIESKTAVLLSLIHI